MKAKELTSQHRIMILEDVLRKLESGDKVGGLCLKIRNSAFEFFQIQDYANKIIPLLTLENARKVTDMVDSMYEGIYWWRKFSSYDFKNRIKFVKWMINEEKEFLK